jgi:hypothetical protein
MPGMIMKPGIVRTQRIQRRSAEKGVIWGTTLGSA